MQKISRGAVTKYAFDRRDGPVRSAGPGETFRIGTVARPASRRAGCVTGARGNAEGGFTNMPHLMAAARPGGPLS